MKIESKISGQQQPNSHTVINFPNGIPSFEDQTKFQLFQQEGSDMVYHLQSLVNDAICFFVVHPSHFNINYNFVLSDEEEATLEIQSPDDLLILLILHKDEDSSSDSKPSIKGSIRSPILINIEKKIGIQKVLPFIEQSITLTDKSNENEIDVSETER